MVSRGQIRNRTMWSKRGKTTRKSVTGNSKDQLKSYLRERTRSKAGAQRGGFCRSLKEGVENKWPADVRKKMGDQPKKLLSKKPKPKPVSGRGHENPGKRGGKKNGVGEN